jgi:ABC-type phosphate/phosphonate transport system substrate-binding protein
MRASLPMYDLSEARAATDAWWSGLAQAFRRAGVRQAPDGLTRGAGARRLWRARDLLFSQTCGYPLIHALTGRLRVIATPVYAVPDCDGPRYRSLLFVRAADPARGLADLDGRVAAVNAPDSHSGCNVLRAMVAPLAPGRRFFRAVRMSGSHAASLALVRRGKADVCAIDCVTHALLTHYRARALDGLRLLARSPAAPGLPYVTAAAVTPDELARLRDGLAEALAAPRLRAVRAALLLEGAQVLPERAYGRIVELERVAERLDCPTLA